MKGLAAVDVDLGADISPAAILDELRSHSESLGHSVGAVSEILGSDMDRIRSNLALQANLRALAHQRYTSAREDRQRLLAMLKQAEERLSVESRVFAAVEDLTRS